MAPGRKLEGDLKLYCDAVYKSDPVKFKRLIEWVYRYQRAGWKDEDLAEALRMFYPHRDKIEIWWSYLTSLLGKAHVHTLEAESESHKRADLTTAREVLKQAFGFKK